PFIPHQALYKSLIGVNLYISEGEIWRLITPMFIHVHFAHFFYNTLSIVIIGPLMEGLLGKWKFLILYFISGLVGNTATFLFLPLTYAHAGSSGAILGLLGSFLLFVLRKKLYISKQNQTILLLIIGISVFMTVFESDINITAHVAGLITGLLYGWVCSKNKE
ncbi:MAG: rhomboid family intramembrane serine protease, partial [Heyndrickxia sp.]